MADGFMWFVCFSDGLTMSAVGPLDGNWRVRLTIGIDVSTLNCVVNND